MSTWMKIAWAIPIILMIVFAWPAARNWMKNGPRGSADDWRAALLPIVGVIIFVVVLMLIARGF